MAHLLFFIGSPPAVAIDFFDERSLTEKAMMIMMSVTMPILYRFIFALCNGAVSKFMCFLKCLFYV
jgi:hypothetical protein